MRASTRCRLLGLVLLTSGWALLGAQLPIRRYSTVDGLANNTVFSIASDPRGFLWFATAEGLSRFDGYGFANQTESTGLPHSIVTEVKVGRHGNYWLATPAGLVRFRPDLPPSSRDRMITLRPDGKAASSRVTALLEDRQGVLWCGTEAGLFAVDNTANAPPRLAEVRIAPGGAGSDLNVAGLAEGVDGSLWIGAQDGALIRRLPDLRIERYTVDHGLSGEEITHVLADRSGRIWVGTVRGLFRSMPATPAGGIGFERLAEGVVPANRVFVIFQSRDGDVWVGLYRCLAQFPADGSPVLAWTSENGLPSRGALSIGQDRDGNLWLGSDDLGAFKLAAGGLLTYSSADGIGMDTVLSVAETLRGELYAAGRTESGGFRVAAQSGNRFQAIAPRVPPSITYFGWRTARVILQDRTGEWWLATSQGLCRYRRLESSLQLSQTAPKAVYTKRDGLPSDVVVRLYEDREGNIWVGTETGQITYWSRSKQKFIAVTDDWSVDFASAFGEDSAGHVWAGLESGQLLRVIDGRAIQVTGLASRSIIHGFLLDRAGRLWVATGSQGLLRFDHPTGPNPQFRQYGYADGLSSIHVQSLTEDGNGFIYIGTGGGVDRLDPDLTHIRHYSPAEGIAAGQVFAGYRERGGAMWFGTSYGLTRMVPQTGSASNPPPVWITGLSIGGRPAEVSEAGESRISRIEVQPGQEHIQFDFVGLSYSPGNILRYQYRLGSEEWSPPINFRSVHYGALAPGAYQFAVRAINSEGAASPTPATVEFLVVPPLWRRTWFQAILLALALAGAFSVHLARMSTLLEIERVRSSIALDLHDDIASNLSQITIFSEIALRETGPDSRAREHLARIAETARETVECISDIVWSIRPQKEGDVLQRIRRFGSDALTSRQIEVSFHFPDEVRHLPLDPNIRRQVYLIYKEAIHNTVRHAQAKAVEISLKLDGRDLVMNVGDNGRGLESRPEGNGLPGMRARATSVGGVLSIRSAAGEGTHVELRVPLRRPRRYGILPG